MDEYHLCETLGKENCKKELENHWDTWYTEQEFHDMKQAGINVVRIPIGYWAWDVSAGEPYKQGQLPYLDKAVTWAGNHGLHLIIDL